jgi:hypothetical protein
MPYRAAYVGSMPLSSDKATAPIPRRLSFPLDYNDLRGMGLPAGLGLRLDPSDPSCRRDRDRLNGIVM